MATAPFTRSSRQNANTGAAGTNTSDPDIIVLKNGNILVSWQTDSTVGPAGTAGIDVLGQIFDPLGNKVGSEIRLNASFFLDDEKNMDMAALPDGGFIVAYEDTDVNGTSIRFNQFNANGVQIPSGPSNIILTDSSTADPNYREPHIAVASATSALIVYQEISGGLSSIVGKLYNPTTFVLGPQFSIMSGGTVGGTTLPDVTALANGNYVVTGSRGDSDNSLVYRLYSSTGASLLGATFVTSTNTNTDNDRDANVTALVGGGFVIAWTNTDTNDTDVQFRVYNSSGTQLSSGDVEVGSSTNQNNEPTIAALADGGFIIAYDNDEVLRENVERFSATGVSLGRFDFGTNGQQPTIVGLGDSRAAVAWTDFTIPGAISFAILDTKHTAHDFGGNDGYADILYRQNSSGNLVLAQLNGSHQAAASAFTDVQLDNNWSIVTANADFDGDGNSDILFRNVASGSTILSRMNGAHQAAASAFTTTQIDNSFAIAGTGDFNGDGKADILYRKVDSGSTLIAFQNGAAVAQPSAFTGTQIDNSFAIAGVGDFDGDGKADILYRKVDSGSTLIAFQNGASVAKPSAFTDVQVGNDWSVNVADFDGDGKSDILFRNKASGQVAISLMNGSAQKAPTAFATVQLDTQFEIAQINDFNGDGKADILYRRTDSGSTLIAFMNGAGQAAPSAFTDVQVDHSWSIV